jgi:hypothetical protein
LDAVFYVGKGTAGRAFHAGPRQRSAQWHRVVGEAGGFVTQIVADGMPEELSFLAEVERIDQLRRLGRALCNLTSGGEGYHRLDQVGRVAHEGWGGAPRQERFRGDASEDFRGRPRGRASSFAGDA